MKTLLALLLTCSLGLCSEPLSFKDLYTRVVKGDTVLVAIDVSAPPGLDFETLAYGYPKPGERIKISAAETVEIAAPVTPGLYEFRLYKGVPSLQPVTVALPPSCPNGRCPNAR